MNFNYFKIGFRNLLKRKFYSFINILGLSVGLASCILIFLFVQYEYSYDEFFTDADQIYRLVEERTTPEGTQLNSHAPYSLARVMEQDYPEVEVSTAIAGPFPNQQVSVVDNLGNKKNFLEQNVLLADRNFFSVFSFELLAGDRNSALSKPNSVVLSKTTAQRLFGNENPLGRFINVSGRSSQVTGVSEDPPANSHFKFSYLVSSSTVKWFSQDSFNLNAAFCYLKLKDGTNPQQLEGKFPGMVDTYLAEEVERVNNISWEEFKASGNRFRYFLKPLTSLHLDADVSGGMKQGGSAPITKGLIFVALLILVIACINYINLSTARSAERAKEVGIRKILGSHKRQLIYQFLTESYFLSFFSILVSIGLVLYLLPQFNRLIGVDISLVFDIETIFILFGSLLIIGLLSGLFPAFVLSAFKPSSVLKGNYTSSAKGKWVRSGSVIFQFWITTTLIISTLVLYKQITFMHEKDLGYKEDQLLAIEGAFDMDPNSTKPFLDEVKKLHGVKGAAGTLWVQGFQGVWSDEYKTAESSRLQKTNRILVGDEYLQLLETKLLEGDLFSKDATDKHYVILNESAARGFGFKEPVGKKLVQVTNDGEEIPFTVKGVIKDFHYESLRSEIDPLVIQSNEVSNGRMSYIAVRVFDGQIQETLKQIEAKWTQLIPNKAFNYRFIDDVIAAKYGDEEKLWVIFSSFSGLCIIISILGLYAISGYTIRQRMKEVSIRKVAGADIKDIILLLGTNFSRMIVISFVLSAPLSWYIATLWLQDYAYRVDLTIGLFLTGGSIIIIVALLSISVNTLKAAIANPIKFLKAE